MPVKFASGPRCRGFPYLRRSDGSRIRDQVRASAKMGGACSAPGALCSSIHRRHITRVRYIQPSSAVVEHPGISRVPMKRWPSLASTVYSCLVPAGRVAFSRTYRKPRGLTGRIGETNNGRAQCRLGRVNTCVKRRQESHRQPMMMRLS